ncbi:MAG TPA: carbohydrate kinase family protein [Candidatus Limnocylindrales bacterium]|nr:carbohydrate kinase family protein [Candidatus Limnocylindrales bacterium]
MPADRRGSPRPPRAVVLGDLVLDVVLSPDEPLRRGTDVSGRVQLRQGGSAATTARWLARSGVPTALVTAVGRDEIGRRLVAVLQGVGVEVRATTLAGAGTGRLGVVLEADGERSFVADRGAILLLSPRHLRAAWFRGSGLLHLPAYSLLAEPLAGAALAAEAWVSRGGGAVSVDLASAGFLDRFGPGAVLDRVAGLRPAVILATAEESAAALGGAGPERLLELAPLVVVKEGAAGARALRRDRRPVAVRGRVIRLRDSTGAGDAFDAGFLAAWLRSGGREHGAGQDAERRGSRSSPDTEGLRRWLRAGQAAARGEVTGRRLILDGLSD